MTRGFGTRFAVGILFAVVSVFCLSIRISLAAGTQSCGTEGADPHTCIPTGTSSTPPTIPAAENPDCNALINNSIFKSTPSNVKILNAEQCAAYKDLKNYNSITGDLTGTGITMLDPTFALSLDNMLKAAQAAGHKIMIISGWRDKNHNAEVGGAQNSNHLKGLAADFQYPDTLGGQSSHTGSFHTCEQTSGVSKAYAWVVQHDTTYHIGTLMQAFNKAPGAYPGECNHVQDTSGLKGVNPAAGLGAGVVTRGAGAGNVAPPYNAATGAGSGTQTCRLSSAGINGTPVYLCNTTSSSNPFSNNGLLGGNSNTMNMMKMMMGMQLGQGLGSVLTGAFSNQNQAPTTQPTPAPLPPVPLPPFPINPITTPMPTGSSTIDALIAALNNPMTPASNGTSTNMNASTSVVVASSTMGVVQIPPPPPVSTPTDWGVSSATSSSTTGAPGPASIATSSASADAGVGTTPAQGNISVGVRTNSTTQGIINALYATLVALRNFFAGLLGQPPTP